VSEWRRRDDWSGGRDTGHSRSLTLGSRGKLNLSEHCRGASGDDRMTRGVSGPRDTTATTKAATAQVELTRHAARGPRVVAGTQPQPPQLRWLKLSSQETLRRALERCQGPQGRRLKLSCKGPRAPGPACHRICSRSATHAHSRASHLTPLPVIG